VQEGNNFVMPTPSSSDAHTQAATNLARRMVSEYEQEQHETWDAVWKKRRFPQWAETLQHLPQFFLNESPVFGFSLTQCWLTALATINSSPEEEDLGDQGLALALSSLGLIATLPAWQEAETTEVEHLLIQTWIERIGEASQHSHPFRLKRLFALAREINLLRPSSVLFVLHALQTRYSQALHQGAELRHDYESALEYVLDSVPGAVLLTLLAQGEIGSIQISLEQAFFLRGAQAPIEQLVDFICDTRQAKASRESALRSLRLLGLSGVVFPIEPLIALLEHSDLPAQILWALSTQGTRVPTALFQAYLGNSDDFLHRCALAGLTAPEQPEVNEILVQALQDADRYVRTDAIETLRHAGKNMPLERIFPLLHDQDQFVRTGAVYALSVLGNQAPIAALLEATQDKDMFVRQAAVDVLAGLGNALPVEQVLTLLRQPVAPFTTVAPNSTRMVLLRALGNLGKHTAELAIPALQKALGDPDPQMVLTAVEALQRLGIQPSPQPLLTHRALTLVRFRTPIVRALSKLGEQTLRSTLLAPTKESSVWEQEAAVAVLAECETADAAESLYIALREKHLLVQIAAMAAMSKHPDLHPDIPLDRLFTYLQSQNQHLQGSARCALWTLGSRVDLPVEMMLTLLDQPAGFPLAYVLGDNCRKLPIEPVSTLLNSHDPEMRKRAIELLGKREEQTVVDLLISMVHDKDSEVRFVLAETLGMLGERIPVEALTTLLQDEDEYVRTAAIKALAQAGERAPLDLLIQTLDDEACDVDIEATRALLSLKAYQPLWQLVEIALHADEPAKQIDAMIKLVEAGVIDHFAAELSLESCLQATVSENQDVRQYATDILTILLKHGRSVPVEPLLTLVEENNERVCGAALTALVEYPSGVPDDLFVRFLDDPRHYPRMCAIIALGKRGAGAFFERLPALLALSGRENQGIRASAVMGLALLGERAPGEALVQALHDAEAHIQWRACEALKQMGPHLPLDLLLPQVFVHDEVVRRQALDIIKTARPDALSHLAHEARARLMADPEGATSSQHLVLFAEAAGFIEQPSPTLIETLVEWLVHPDQEVRIQAALALGCLQQPLPDHGWQRLFALRASTNTQAVQQAATDALHELLSMESGPSSEPMLSSKISEQ